MIRESLWIELDPDLVTAIDELAKAKGITRHDAARIVLKLGVEVMQQHARGGQLELTPREEPRP